MIVIDTFAWIEYFIGTKKGEIVKEYLKQEKLITPSIVLLELSIKSAKENWNFSDLLNFIKSNIIGLKEDIIEKCGKIYFKERKKKSGFSMIDAVILAITRENNAKILTKDNHFRDLSEAIMI